jgi:hypothetical protein
MWSDHEYDDDTYMEYPVDLNEDRPNPFGHNIVPIKTSLHCFANLIPWYTSGFK